MYNKNNIFAKILRNEIPCSKIFENDFLLAFEDINKKAKIHVLVIPKGEYINMNDFIEKASNDEILGFFKGFNEVLKKINLSNGYRIISNIGEEGGQEVPHMHIHILGGEHLGAMVSKK